MMGIHIYRKGWILGVIFSSIVLMWGCKDSGPGASNLTGMSDFSIKGFDNTEFKINQSTMEITNGTDSLAYGTDPSALVATFETVPKTKVTVGGTEQVSGMTENDFTNPVIYEVTAEDGETTEKYMVTVTVAQLNPKAVNWSEQTDNAAWGPFTQSIMAQPYNNQLWILGFSAGNLYFDQGDQVFGTFNSMDGAAWSEIAANDDAGRSMPAAVDGGLVNYDGEMWLVNGVIPPAGFTFEVFTTKSWHSSDGISWTEVDTTGTGSNYVGREGQSTLVFNDHIYTIGGFTYAAFGTPAAPGNDVWSTTDGKTWTEETDNAGFDGRYYPAAFVFNGAMWITGGRKNDGTLLNDVWKSTDGKAWTEVNTTNPYTPRFGHKVVVYDGKLWLIGGEGMDQSGNAVTYKNLWTSEDGKDWQKVTDDNVIALPANYDGRARHDAFVYDDQIWITGGYRIDSGGNKVYMNDVWSGKLNGLSSE